MTRNARRAKGDADGTSSADGKRGAHCPSCGRKRDKQFGWAFKIRKRKTDPTMFWICGGRDGCFHKWQFTDAEALAYWLRKRGGYFPEEKAAAVKVGWTPELQARYYEEQ